MKRFTPLFLLAALALSFSSCTTKTETLPDGTVIKTEGVDGQVVSTAALLGTAYLANQTSSK